MNWFKRLRMRTKLTAAFIGVLSLTVLVGLFSIERMAGLQALADEIDDRWLPDIESLGMTRGDVREFQIHELNLLLAVNDQEIAGEEKALAELRAKIAPSIAEHETDPFNDEERTLGQAARKGWDEYMIGHAALVDLVHKGKLAEARALAQGPQRERYGAVVQRLDDLVAMHVRLSDERTRAAGGMFRSGRQWILGMIVASVLLGVGLSIFIARVMTAALGRMIAAVSRASEGDLTARVEIGYHDEIGEASAALNGFLEGLCVTMADVAASSAQVATASEQLSASSEILSTGTQEQAASIEETTASLSEMATAVRHNAETARQASVLASGARDTPEAARAPSASSAMAEINKASKRIGEIIGVIDEIAFQTNLLALNAAVEAARAGEQGRGFAVVAAEVRTLAQRSATAAKEIKALINDSLQKVEDGSALVKRVTDFMVEIAAASGQQATGIGQLDKAVSQMDQVVQSNSSQSEELTATAAELTVQAEQLRAMVDRFQLDCRAGQRAPAARPASAEPPRAPAAVRAPMPARLAAAPRRRAASFRRTDPPMKRSEPPPRNGHDRGPAGKGTQLFEDF